MSHVKSISDSESTAMLAFLQSYTYPYCHWFIHPRNILIYLTLLDTGIRLGELVKLHWYDLIGNKLALKVLHLDSKATKTGIPRSVPLTNRLQSAINKFYSYLEDFSYCTINNHVFTPPFKDQHLSCRQVRRIITDFSFLSIHREISPHQLRHTFATRVLRSSSTRVVQELLGHKSLSSTQIYTHPNSTDLRDAIDKM